VWDKWVKENAAKGVLARAALDKILRSARAAPAK
jgi:hypothetical protein